MEATSSTYIVWTSETSADRFSADNVVEGYQWIFFILDNNIVKKYRLEDFYHFNPTWQRLENAE